jgi:hypothetical protein
MASDRFHRRLRPTLFAAALALGSLYPHAALAEPTAGERETARALMNEGDRKSAAKDYAGALKAYQGAHAIMSVPSTGAALARTQAAMLLLVEARDTALQVTRMPVRPNESSPFTKARTAAEKLAQELATRIPSLQITVQGPPPSADVRITFDGQALPSTVLKFPYKANPGRHNIAASAGGFADASREVDLREGESASVILSLTASATKTAASAPPKSETQAAARSDTPSLLGREAADASPGASPLVYIGFAVGGAGLIAGSVAGVLHLSRVAQVKDDYCAGGTSCDPGFAKERDQAMTLATASNIGFAVAAVGVGVGIIGLATSKSAKASSTGGAAAANTAYWEPVVGVGSIGVRGGF